MYTHYMNAKIKKWGNSLGLRLPSVFIKQLGLKDDDVITISIEDGKIIIEPDEIDINQLIETITPESLHKPIDWGPPVGKEIW